MKAQAVKTNFRNFILRGIIEHDCCEACDAVPRVNRPDYQLRFYITQLRVVREAPSHLTEMRMTGEAAPQTSAGISRPTRLE
jgi:hypothetical protein